MTSMAYLVNRIQVMLTNSDYYKLKLKATDSYQSVSSLARNIICNMLSNIDLDNTERNSANLSRKIKE